LLKYIEQKTWIKPELSKTRWFVGGLIGLALVPALWFGWNYVPYLLSFITNREAVVAYMQGFGIWSAVVLVSINT